MTFFFCCAFGVYFIWVLALRVGWPGRWKFPRTPAGGVDTQFITVVIAFRNEIQNWKGLFASLRELDYPKEKFEILFVDDHSTDGSDAAFRNAIRSFEQGRLIELPEGVEGKKSALTEGIAQARGTLIAVTDADCMVPPNWLFRINEAFQEKGVKMVFGGVGFRRVTSFMSAVQALEFSSLIGAGAALLYWKFFVMCNGANMAFLKSAFDRVDGYRGNTAIASGDDIFLAEKIIALFPDSMRFIRYRDAVVTTVPQPSVRAWISQRVRWAGKWKYSRRIGTKIVAVSVVAFQLIWLSLLVLLALGRVDGQMGGLLIAGKLLVEWMFIFPVSHFLHSKWSWRAFLALQLIYPFYILGVGLIAQRGVYYWKGRRLLHRL